MSEGRRATRGDGRAVRVRRAIDTSPRPSSFKTRPLNIIGTEILNGQTIVSKHIMHTLLSIIVNATSSSITVKLPMVMTRMCRYYGIDGRESRCKKSLQHERLSVSNISLQRVPIHDALPSMIRKGLRKYPFTRPKPLPRSALREISAIERREDIQFFFKIRYATER